MANIYDIAKHANVSPTVSRAINKSGYVSKETYAIIMKSVEALDYRKNVHVCSFEYRFHKSDWCDHSR
ncbi:LacI family DNA-binding transcriptional regulator [Erysipelothrix sp. D19-032]